MIQSQGYWMELECSDCGTQHMIKAAGKQQAVKLCRDEGWMLSRSSHACWCPSCKTKHTYKNRPRLNREVN